MGNRLGLSDIHSKSIHIEYPSEDSNDGHRTKTKTKGPQKMKTVAENFQVAVELDTIKYDDAKKNDKHIPKKSGKKVLKRSFFQEIIHAIIMHDDSVTHESTSEVSTEDEGEGPARIFTDFFEK